MPAGETSAVEIFGRQAETILKWTGMSDRRLNMRKREAA
jgi:hypothetical protein